MIKYDPLFGKAKKLKNNNILLILRSGTLLSHYLLKCNYSGTLRWGHIAGTYVFVLIFNLCELSNFLWF